jgi:hypothetical protein
MKNEWNVLCAFPQIINLLHFKIFFLFRGGHKSLLHSVFLDNNLFSTFTPRGLLRNSSLFACTELCRQTLFIFQKNYNRMKNNRAFNDRIARELVVRKLLFS